MQKKIHINTHLLKANEKDGGNRPVITVKTYKDNVYGHEVTVKGTMKVVYSKDKPLSCGARIWLSTEDDVEILNTETNETIKI